MAEWSKAIDSSSILFGGVSSNLTECIKQKYIFFFLFFYFFLIFFYKINKLINQTLWPSG
jgi:hypothetical protein